MFAALLVATIYLAGRMSFLCDDAYITFRYVANAHAGHGLVWNPAPFAPVEGYSGFLWALCLWATWSWFGVEPPAAANVLSLLCGLGQLAVIAAAALRLPARGGGRLPDAVAFCVLVAVVGNRTFLTWLSGGLETALFDLLFLAWVLHAFRAPARRGPGWLAVWSGLATAAALTRPDGLLCVAATGAAGALAIAGAPGVRWRFAAGLAPLLLTAAHLAWRRAYYGEWLPNTYYAKVDGAWPEAGWRYFACFAVEHGVWLWLPLGAVWVGVELARGARAAARAVADNLPAAAAVAAVVFHFGYYTFVVGGDHFEYRVYSHLVPLGLLAAAAMAARLASGWRLPVAVTLALLLANGVGWLHLWLTRDMDWLGLRPIAADLPAVVRPLGRWFDRNQAWLRLHLVGLRCRQHALFLDRLRAVYPGRMPVEGATDPYPAYATESVGLAGWSLPDAVIVDLHGLNDWVLARSPTEPVAPLAREQVQALFGRADADRDGLVDERELRTLALLATGDRAGGTEEGAFLARLLLAVHAHSRPDALTAAEAEDLAASLVGVRTMAHARHPPPGYLEEYECNVRIDGGRAQARPRRTPMTPARIRDLEARWRDRVRAGQR